VQWFNPRSRKPLQNGSVLQVQGPGWHSIGLPPQNDGQDWVCLVNQLPASSVKKGPATLSPAASTSNAAGQSYITVYPNPILDYLTIATRNDQNAPLEITLQDVTGKQILRKTALPTQNQETPLNTSQLKPGVYLLRVKQGAAFLNQKVVKY
jgi:hypothetical protein